MLARGWVNDAPLVWSHAEYGSLSLVNPDLFARGLHAMRTQWRWEQLGNWLRSKRRDATLIRAAGGSLTGFNLDRFRKLVQNLDAHCIAIITGGMKTEAAGTQVQNWCTCCQLEIFPSLDHILWECSRFSHLRVYPKPPNIWAQRLGWDPDTYSIRLIRQMAQIRACEVKIRLQQLKSNR